MRIDLKGCHRNTPYRGSENWI